MKILWVKSDFLFPADTGGKIRSYNILKQLAFSHAVDYLCLTDEKPSPDAIDHLKGFCRNVDYIPFRSHRKFSMGFYWTLIANLFSKYPYVIRKYESAKIAAEIRWRIDRGEVDILVCDFLEMAINLRGIREIPKVLFQHNVETEIWRRHYQVSRNPLKRFYLYLDYRKFFDYEKAACSDFDDVIVVSESDAALLKEKYEVPRTTLVPTGVDVNFFRPNLKLQEKKSLIFVGSMDWLPNQDAVEYFAKEIYPRIKVIDPGVRFHIVGRRPPEKIIRLGQADKSIIVIGTVADVRPFVDRARVYVVPLRIGGGTRIKIFEAMAQKKAIVSTSVGAEGLPVVNGEHLLIRDNPAEFAEAVCRLINDDKLSARMGENGCRLVNEKYSWQKVALKFAEALEKLLISRSDKVIVSGISGES